MSKITHQDCLNDIHNAIKTSKEMFDEFYQTQKLKEIRKNTPLIKLVGLIKNVLEPEEIEIIIRNLKHE